ncbi:YceI family protein [Aurantibacter crassamenti]|uniref:YceI family protein n=1 Tax=Aurantibacter crassamenti TaxID=1837375 RepID=UPI00193A4C51|nr:YceI family protein [Aurantibacter crassamenti]MBM1107203.1 YceI family protein [Aurantibacter crassamenti]
MKIKLFIFFLALCPIALIGQSTAIQSAEITFNFEAKDVDGSISDFQSESILDFENIEKSILKGSVGVKSIKTGIFLRDWSLKGSKYFDEDTHQRIYFESNAITATTNGFIAEGTLTIKAIEKPLRITFQKQGNQLIGTATMNSADYGISIKKQHDDNKVTIKLVFTLN